jgi:MotA/TolQ/ExbB proton channel family
MAKTLLKKKFYFWWLSVLLIATFVFWASYMGFVAKIWYTDITMLSSVIVAMFVFANIKLGYVSYGIDKHFPEEKLVKETDTIWFISEMLMAIGMLGTVIGLIHMLAVNMIGNDLQDSNSIQQLLGHMWESMGLALYTNAVGLATSIVLKLQVHFIAGDLDDAS